MAGQDEEWLSGWDATSGIVSLWAEAPGQVQVCRPYLSVTGPRLCLTLSLGCIVEGALVVACVDIDYVALAGDDLSFGVGVADRV